MTEPGGLDELAHGPEPGRRRVPSWLWRAAGITAVAALAVTVGPSLLSGGRERSDAPRPAPRLTPSTPPPLPADLRWAPRGDLAGDRAFLAAVSSRVAGHELRLVGGVLWAGRLPVRGGAPVRAALVAGVTQKDDGDSVFVPVVGVLVPDGAAPAAARVDRVDSLDLGDQVLGWWAQVGGGDSVAVVLGPPRPLTVRLSGGVAYASDGTRQRTYQTRTGADGVVVVRLPALDYPAPAFADADGLVAVLRPSPAARRPGPIAGLSASTYAGPPVFRVVNGVAAAVSDPPLVGGPVQVRLLWSGPVRNGSAALVLYTRADGATFHQWYVSGLAGGSQSAVYPVPRSAALTYPAVIELQTPGAGNSASAVLDPVGAGSVTFVDATGHQVTRRSDRLGLTGFALGEFVAGDRGRLVLHDRLGTRTVPVDPPAERDPLALDPGLAGTSPGAG